MLPIATTGQIKDGYVGGNLTIDLSEYMKKKDGATKTELDELTSVVANKLDASPIHKHDVSDIKELQEELDSKYDTSKRYSYNTILSDSEKIPFIESPKMLSMEIASQFDMDGYKFYVDNSSGDLMITLNDIVIGFYSKAASKWSWEQVPEACSCGPTLEALVYKVNNHTHSEYLTELPDHTHDYAATNHTHKTLDNDLTVTGTISAKKLTSNTMTFESIDANAGKCSIDGTEIWRVQKNSWMYIYKILSLSQSLIVDENATVRKNLNVKESLTLNGWDVETKIKEMEAILKNHYEALLMLCEKHEMIDSNTSDGDKISPENQK